MTISRRDFVVLTGAAIMASSYSFAQDAFPPMLDHIILGCNDLSQGIDFVERHTGVRAAIGGSHPNRGTKNALLSLGTKHYLEIMAPDPDAAKVQPSAMAQVNALKKFLTPQLLTWAIHTADIEETAKRLREAGMAASGPTPGSRVRPDGRILNWKTLNLEDNRGGLLPFVIEWAPGSVHPSSDAPAGCSIERFSVVDPDPMALRKALQTMGVDMAVETGATSQLRARISGPRAMLEVSS